MGFQTVGAKLSPGDVVVIAEVISIKAFQKLLQACGRWYGSLLGICIVRSLAQAYKSPFPSVIMPLHP